MKFESKSIRQIANQMPREQLENRYVELVEHWNEFEKFLMNEIGKDFYIKLVREFALNKSVELLDGLELTKEEIKEYLNEMANEMN